MAYLDTLRERAFALQQQELDTFVALVNLENQHPDIFRLARTSLADRAISIAAECKLLHDQISILIGGQKWTEISNARCLLTIIDHQQTLADVASECLAMFQAFINEHVQE